GQYRLPEPASGSAQAARVHRLRHAETTAPAGIQALANFAFHPWKDDSRISRLLPNAGQRHVMRRLSLQEIRMQAFQTPLYTAKVRTTGGRNGASRSSDGRLDVKHSIPGGPGEGTNPEQLFAAGWSACFEGALARVAQQHKITLPADTAIDAE